MCRTLTNPKSACPSTAFMLSMRSTAPSRPRSLSRSNSQTRNSEYTPGGLGRALLTIYSPLFVTWNTRSSRPGRAPRLRGCIGTFEPLPIRDGIAEYALISAFKDSRFRKIEKHELESLECGYASLRLFTSLHCSPDHIWRALSCVARAAFRC